MVDLVVDVHGQRPAGGALAQQLPAGAVGLRDAQRAHGQDALVAGVLVGACGLADEKVAPADRTARTVLKMRSPRASDHTRLQRVLSVTARAADPSDGGSPAIANRRRLALPLLHVGAGPPNPGGPPARRERRDRRRAADLAARGSGAAVVHPAPAAARRDGRGARRLRRRRARLQPRAPDRLAARDPGDGPADAVPRRRQRDALAGGRPACCAPRVRSRSSAARATPTRSAAPSPRRARASWSACSRRAGWCAATALGPIQRGAALIATRAGVPLVPIAIAARPARVRIGAPLPPTRLDARADGALEIALRALVDS